MNDVRALFLPFLPAEPLPAEPLLMPRYTPFLWEILDAAVEEGRERQICKDLKQDRQLKNAVLEYVQSGMLIRWLDRHPDTLVEILRRHIPELDAGIDAKFVPQTVKRGVPVTRDWFQQVAPAIKQDQKEDAEARAAPDLAEIQSPEQWQPDNVESLRNRPVVVFPNNTESSRERARSVAQALKGIAATVRIIDMRDPEPDILDELAACELFGFQLRRCQFGDHWTLGDEHFRHNCKMHQKAKRLSDLYTYKARKTR